jgi:hypothetical protein
VRGTFNNWDKSNELLVTVDNVYSITVGLPENSYYEYKYYITSPGAENNGWENSFPVTEDGNRMISIGINDLDLAVVIYNDADMDRYKSTDHFNFYYTSADNGLIDDFALRAEKCHNLVATALQSSPTAKTNIYLYKDLDQLHLAQGYPENGENSIGSAYGKSKLVMLAPSKLGFDEAIGLLAHEYTHCLEAWKTKVSLPAWLNEGVACYYGRNFSTKDWIKSEMTKQGKPNISEVFNGNMGYAYSGIIAYYIIKTKGEAAMAKFVENMNYSDIGYSNLAALQADWWSFLDVYLDYQTTVNVKFSVDMADMVSVKYFNPGKDKVYLKGSFSEWTPQLLTLESGTVYSGTFAIKRYNLFEYKFYTNSSVAPNGGLELNFDDTTLGNRLLDVENGNKTLPVVKFNSNAAPGLDMNILNNKINVLKLHALPYAGPSFSNFKYAFKVLTNEEFNAKKPTDILPFDVGFIAADGTINVSVPTTDAQRAVFKDINKAAAYYLCQSYMYFFYQTKGLPLLFSVGFSAYEAGLDPTDTTIKEAINNYGGSFPSFDLLNNPTTFISNSGWTVAYAFGEFMNVYKNWGYPMVINVTAKSFDVTSGWFNTDNLKGLLDDFNRYLNARFLQPDENLRVKMVLETEHFKFYTCQRDYLINFPDFSETVESAYKEYQTNYNVSASEKLTFFTLSACSDVDIEGIPCNSSVRLTGGTAWSSGLHSTCAVSKEQLSQFIHQNRHELAHTFQALMPQGSVTAWLNEGFPDFCANGPILSSTLSNIRQQGIDALNSGTTYFGHRPTYEDTKVYPSPDFGYYTLGYLLNDFIYRKGGYQALKDVQMGDLDGYKKLGYLSRQSFLDDFYFDFDVRLQGKPVVMLKTPQEGVELTNQLVNISWVPLKSNVKYNVKVSTDNKANWNEIAGKTTQTSADWESGTYNGKFFLKFVAPENLDLESVYGPFTVTDISALSLNFPNGGEYLIAEDTVKVGWATTSIPNIKLEYSEDNGTSWKQINASTSTAEKQYKWVVPNISSSQCKLRISDVSNPAKSDVSEKVFTILKNNLVGGPYLFDKNTLLLLHFDNDLNNRAYASGDAAGSVENIQSDETRISEFGNAYQTLTTATIKNTPNLSLTGDWTIEAWVKPTAINPNINNYILTKPGDTDPYISNYSLEINPWWSNSFHGFFFSGPDSRTGKSLQSVTLNEWYHVAFIRDTKNNQIRIIVRDKNRNKIADGVQSYETNAVLVNSKDLIIGSGFSGYIDELRISNVVRGFSITGVSDLDDAKKITISPNPSDGNLSLKWDNTFDDSVCINILNISGQVMYSERRIGSNGTTLSLSFLPKGIYIVQLITNTQKFAQKVIFK